MEALLDYLDEIEELLDQSKSAPFSNKIYVEKGKIMEIIGDIRLSLPKDIQTAQRIISDQQRLLDDATDRAQMMIDDAEEEVQRMISSHEIFRRASERAEEVILDAEREQRDRRLNAIDFADGLLGEAEQRLKEHISEFDRINTSILNYYHQLSDTIYDSRQQLKGL